MKDTIGSVLVVGAGIAGIQASLDLTELGFKVYLVEKSPSIGGRMAQLDKLFPDMSCSLCSLIPKMVAVYKNPNIILYTLTEVKKVKGKAGNFTVTLEKNPRYVDETKCRACGDCAKKCPKVETPNLFDMNLGKRKSIYIPFPQAIPPIYLIDSNLCLYMQRGVCGVCSKVCKAGAIDYDQKPEQLTLQIGVIILSTGFDMLGEELAPTWGYQYKNVVNALEFERISCPTGPFGAQILRPSDEKEPKTIAFIHCASSGYSKRETPYCSRVCCMYTTKNGILAKNYINDAQIAIFRHNIRVFGKNFYEFTKEAEKQHGIHYYFSKVHELKEDPETNDILIYYDDLKTNDKNKVFRANLAVLAAPLVPSRGTKELAKIMGVELDQFGFFKEKSYFNKSLSTREGVFLCGFCHGPMNISETVADASGVASQVATMLRAKRHSLTRDREIDILSEREIIRVHPVALIIGGGISGMTAALNIANQGFKTYVIEKEGRLGGNLNHVNVLYPIQEKASLLLEKTMTEIKANEKIHIFLKSKIERIKGSIGNYDVSIISSDGRYQEIKVGVIIVAIGAQEFKPHGLFQYSELNNNILTHMELEKLLKKQDVSWLDNIHNVTFIMCVNARQRGGYSYCSNICCSNTIKNINILKELKPGLDVLVLIRELHVAKKEFEKFASKRKKFATYLKYDLENIPRIKKINKDPEKYEITLQDYQDPTKSIHIKTDLIILSTPLIPRQEVHELASMLKIPIDEYGFFVEAHEKLRPLDFVTEGIFVCGCAQWPKNVQDSIIEANAAAGRASRFLTMKEISATRLEILSFLLSIECFFKDVEVNLDKCNGCGNCAEVCVFEAISLVDIRQEYEDVSIPTKKAYINPAICRGCGRCAATCRLKAIVPRHHDIKEIERIIDPYFLEKAKSPKDKEELTIIE